MDTKVALITGASRGIGRAITLALAQHGWLVGINFSRQVQAAETLLVEIQEKGGNGLLLPADISQTNERKHLLERMMSTCQRLDLLVNNAGIAPQRRTDLLEMDEDSYDEVMNTNLKGPFFLTQQAAQLMIQLLKQGIISNPKIINIGSMSAYTSSVQRGAYCLSKAGIGMMTILFADRLAEEGILVYEVRPGIIATDMTAVVQDKYDQLINDGLLPLSRWGTPQDVAQAVVALAEGALPYSTGEVINVDGGFHLRRL